MIRILLDHHIREQIFHGLRRRRPTFDVVRVRDEELSTTADPTLLQWAHELSHAEERIAQGDPIAGVFMVRDRLSNRAVIEELLLIDDCSEQMEWANAITYLPLKAP